MNIVWVKQETEKPFFYEKIVQAVLNKKHLYISAKIDQMEMSGLLVVSITSYDKEKKAKDLEYFYKRRYVGFSGELREKLSNAMIFKQTELELIAREEV